MNKYFFLFVVINFLPKNPYQINTYLLRNCESSVVTDSSLHSISESLNSRIILYKPVKYMDEDEAKSILLFMNDFLKTDDFTKTCKINVSNSVLEKMDLALL